MNWIFPAFLFASMLHMTEEYFYPGGFMQFMKHLNPGYAPFVTIPMAVIVNVLQLVFCVIAILLGRNGLIFSMSIAALLFINGLAHIAGCIKVRGYAPGVGSGALLYLPLSLYAYSLFLRTGQLTPNQVVITGLLGLLYQAVPIVYLSLARARSQA
jgi:hypothetical protein